MFEVTGSDIERLSDTELRALVVRLATSELRKQGLPLSSVTAGGHQDAADGGLDVRVDCPSALLNADFVPRRQTGFQVKKPDMAASAIRDEMRPKTSGKETTGGLRPVIVELASHQGAYIIVSAQGSVADKPLRDRRQAMRAQLSDLAAPEDLYTDFYDRDRLAAWVNEYPGIAAWVRGCANRPIDGWSSIDRWGGAKASGPFLTDTSTCLMDESRKPGEALPLTDGVERLRSEMRRPGRCVRLIGLSGLGKTRLVQALFEKDVGENPLDVGLAVYTDYSTETRPTARDMARELIGSGKPAILIVDNCNPETHSELAKLCSEPGSLVSLLTVEYDVREDEPEHTDVFRLQAASSELLEKWLGQTFGHISQVDRRTIAEFSHGNFRVARALAETLKRGETLGQVKSRDLFERIFRQRNLEDKSLLMAAEDLALAYSVNGEDISLGGELGQLSAVRGIEAEELYQAVAELRRRDVAQARGRWRAILPQAIANGLAAKALTRIHPDVLDTLMSSASPRLRLSISRRLGNLHDSPEARAAAARWLAPGGALGNLYDPSGASLQIVTNLAPLAPADVLWRVGVELNAHPKIASTDSKHRWEWIRLIKALGYEPEHFNAAATILVRFAVAESESTKSDWARDALKEMFQLRLSGTQAPPAMRRDMVEALLNSSDPTFQACGLLLLQALLKTSYFSSNSSFDFGARSRSWGWEPELNRDVWDWYVEAVRLCTKAVDRFDGVRRILSRNARELWQYQACHDSLEDAVNELLKQGPWIEGWIALRAALRLDGEQMPPTWRGRLEALIDRVKPIDLLSRARAALLSRDADGWDISDGEADDGDGMPPWETAALMAESVGRELANDPFTREKFMRELMAAPNQERAFNCGMGLAVGAYDLDAIWQLLLTDFEKTEVSCRRPDVLGGYLKQASTLNAEFAERALDDAVGRESLAASLPYLQSRVAVDKIGIERLRRAISANAVEAWSFSSLAYGGVLQHSPPEALTDLLCDVAGLPGGTAVALDVLHMSFFGSKSTHETAHFSLAKLGRQLLTSLDRKQFGGRRAHAVAAVIKISCSGSDSATAELIARTLRDALEAGDIRCREGREVLKALCEIQPHKVLDVFLLSPPEKGNTWRFDVGCRNRLPNKLIGSAVLLEWASIDPETRFALLSPAMSLFSRGDFAESSDIDSIFVDLLRLAPDKTSFLGRFAGQVYPSHIDGSFKAALECRRAQLVKLAQDGPEEVANWVDKGLPDLDRWISEASDMDRDEEESFE